MNAPPPSDPGLAVGEVLGDRYKIEATLGAGAMGVVYRASRLDGLGDVAVKVVLEDAHQPDVIAEQRERFDREAKALFGMEHPHVLQVFDSGVSQGRPYLVMELLEGSPLDVLVEEGPLAPDEAFAISVQILEGLAFAHAKGVIHRDLKTENIFLSRNADGTPCAKILDFGLVKFVDDARWGESSKLTITGAVFGTPAYMPPEQCAGAKVDERGDVYACGVILFELFTGEWPFMEESRMEMFKAHLSKPVPKLAQTVPGAKVVPELDAVIQKAMSKLAKQRYQDAGEMLEDLRRVPQPAMVVTDAQTPAEPGTPSSPLLNPFSDYPSGTSQTSGDGRPKVVVLPARRGPAPAINRPSTPPEPAPRASYGALAFAAFVLMGLAGALAWVLLRNL